MATSSGGFLTSTGNVVATAAAAVGAAVSGVVGTGVLGLGGPGAAAVVVATAVGCYGAAFALTPGHQEAPAFVPEREWTEQELRDRLSLVARRARGLPAPVASVLTDVTGDLAQILDRWDVLSRAPETSYEVCVAITDYLPSALNAYERIPVDLRERSRSGRPTPTGSLRRQLEVLHDHLTDIRDAAFESDIAALESYERFITDKYARSELDL